MRTRLLVWLAALLLALGCGESVWGQYSTSNSGMFGSRTMGGNVTAGNRTFGGTSGSGLGGGGLGGGLGSSSFNSGMGSMGLGSSGSSSGMLGGSERFVRGNRQAGQFVGTSTQDMGNVLGGSSNLSGSRGTGQASRSGLNTQSSGRGTPANQPNQRGRSQSRRPGGGGRVEDVRTKITADFRYPQPVPVEVNSSLSTFLQKSTRIAKIGPIRVVFEGGTTILRGAVETEHDRALAEQLARLEPGVRRVKNELVVGPASASGTAPPASEPAAAEVPEAPLPAGSPGTGEPLNPGEPPAPR